MQLTKIKLLVIVVIALEFIYSEKTNAQVTDAIDSTVRIICPEPSKTNPNRFSGISIKLPNGESIDGYGYSAGTGFVINSDGYILTNNHVVAEDAKSYVASKLILVVQKSGDRYLLHKAKVVYLSPNQDLAVIQCPQLKTIPVPLAFADKIQPNVNDEVLSVGFPGIGDQAVEDQDKAQQITDQIIIQRIINIKEELERKYKRPLTQEEIKEIADYVREHTQPWSAEINSFLGELDAYLGNNAAKESWDITDVVKRKSLWGGYFNPTVTRGNIERVMNTHGYLGAGYPDIAVIQHSCSIKHGNSGGPLLNADGEAVGVVGRGVSETNSGSSEAIQWATRISEIKSWLETNKVGFVPGNGVRHQLPLKLIVPIALAFAVAVAALVLVSVKVLGGGEKSPKGTKTVSEMVNEKVRDQLLKLGIGRPLTQPPYEGPLPGFDRWQLVGHGPGGQNFRLDIPDVMFTSNANRIILGRAEDLCHLVIKDTSVSRQHAQIRKVAGGFVVADRNSSNNTAVNGLFSRKVFEEVPLKEGDTLTMGDVKLDFRKL